mmetsp:Transcript_4994/g.9653  ORF Transcript_4994/g.9653 Transcript_4994/m.9653 type:complete len:458 (-) Transcript_4994:81-1454(-)
MSTSTAALVTVIACIGACFWLKSTQAPVLLLAMQSKKRKRRGGQPGRPQKVVRTGDVARYSGRTLIARLLDTQVVDDKEFKQYLRIPRKLFLRMVRELTPYFPRLPSQRPDTLSVGERLALTLAFLMNEGGGLQKVVKLFGRSVDTVRSCVADMCELICRVYFADVICLPTLSQIREISASLFTHRRLPLVFGAIDGKHFEVSGGVDCNERQMLRNYKKYWSLNVIAMADHHYRFRSVGLFFNGSVCDGTAFREGELYRFFHSSDWTDFCNQGIETIVINDKTIYPYVVADAAFHGSPAVLKPYSKVECERNRQAALFNKIHSSARQIIEQAWGILVKRFNILRGSIPIWSKDWRSRTEYVIGACMIIHNLCIDMKLEMGKEISEVAEEWLKRKDTQTPEWTSADCNEAQAEVAQRAMTEHRIIRNHIASYLADLYELQNNKVVPRRYRPQLRHGGH